MGKNSAEFTSELQVAERAGSPSALSRELVSATMTEDAAIHEMMDEANRGVVFRQPHASFLSGHSPAGEAPITSFVSSPSSGRRASQPTVTIREGDPSVIGYLGRRRAGSTSAASSIRPGSVDSYYSGRSIIYFGSSSLFLCFFGSSLFLYNPKHLFILFP